MHGVVGPEAEQERGAAGDRPSPSSPGTTRTAHLVSWSSRRRSDVPPSLATASIPTLLICRRAPASPTAAPLLLRLRRPPVASCATASSGFVRGGGLWHGRLLPPFSPLAGAQLPIDCAEGTGRPLESLLFLQQGCSSLVLHIHPFCRWASGNCWSRSEASIPGGPLPPSKMWAPPQTISTPLCFS